MIKPDGPFFGRIIIEPTTVEHRRGDLANMIASITDAYRHIESKGVIESKGGRPL
jgi:hypothetical protein